MKLRDFHKYGTIDITCSKKVTLSQSSNKKAITNDTKFFIFAIPLVRRVRARRNEESSAPSNVNTLTSLRQQCAEKGLPTYGCRKMQPVPASKPTPQTRQDRGQHGRCLSKPNVQRRVSGKFGHKQSLNSTSVVLIHCRRVCIVSSTSFQASVYIHC